MVILKVPIAVPAMYMWAALFIECFYHSQTILNCFSYHDLQIIDVIRTGVDKGTAIGHDAESKGFAELAMTPQSKGLMALFRGQTECKKNRFGTPKTQVK